LTQYAIKQILKSSFQNSLNGVLLTAQLQIAFSCEKEPALFASTTLDFRATFNTKIVPNPRHQDDIELVLKPRSIVIKQQGL
jgi:hypothetical protein